MKEGLPTPFYNPELSYDQNYEEGPFGGFRDSRKNERSTGLGAEFLGKPVDFPFGVPAGPLLNSNFVIAALDMGFPIATYKTVRSVEQKSQPLPNVVPLDIEGPLTLEMAEAGIRTRGEYRRPISITNSFGVPSRRVDIWQEDMARAVSYARDGQLVVGSFQGTKKGDGDRDSFIADYALAAKLVKETGAEALEANLSCPNEGTSHLVCFDVGASTRIVESIKNEIGNTPLIIKIAYFQDQDHLRELVRSLGNTVDAISAINTIPSRVFDQEGNPALGEGRERAGVCGAPIKWAGLEMTGRLRVLREELGLGYEIVGVGGVTTPSDYHDYIDAGADAVMSATGAMWNPFLAQEIKG